ncbi:MAG: DUF2993 domain-containing protein [Cyanobacteria bacterium J06623_5]
MEIVTVLLSGLLLLISPVGVVVDQVAENALRDLLIEAESLDVRIDNGPSYQLLQGKVSKVRIAGRGISPIEGLRLEVAELETDAIDLAFGPLRRGEVILDQPFQGAAHLVLTEGDVNAFLLSPFVQAQLSQFTIGGLSPAQARERDRYRIADPSVDFLDNGRIQVTVTLEDLVVPEDSLLIDAEVGLSILQGERLMLVEPMVSANGQPVPPRLIDALVGGFMEQLSLQQLEAQGITTRVLNLSTQEDFIDLALWVRVDPGVTAADVAAEATESSLVE